VVRRSPLPWLHIAKEVASEAVPPFYDEPDRNAAIDTVRRAPDIGVDFLDTSDAYGQRTVWSVRWMRGPRKVASRRGTDPRLVSSAASRLIFAARPFAPSWAKSTAVALPLLQPRATRSRS
jgi:hypothetical protein